MLTLRFLFQVLIQHLALRIFCMSEGLTLTLVCFVFCESLLLSFTQAVEQILHNRFGNIISSLLQYVSCLIFDLCECLHL